MEKIYINQKNVNFVVLTNNSNNLYYKNVIYQIIINNKYYIGCSKRELIQRLKEHVDDIISDGDVINVIVIKKNLKENNLKVEERKYIKYIGNKILKRFYKSKYDYNNPLIFNCLKNNMLNKIL